MYVNSLPAAYSDISTYLICDKSEYHSNGGA